MADVVVHGLPPSSYTMTARMACGEKGITHDVSPVQLGTEALAELHPFSKVPILEHGDVRIYETSAICRYIDDEFEGPSLAPSDPKLSALMEQWISVVNCYVYEDWVRQYILQYIFPRGEGGAPDRAAIDAAVPRIDHQLGLLDKDLADRKFLCGDTVSIADIFLTPLLAGIARFDEGKALLGKHPGAARLLGTLVERPAFQASIPREA